MSNLIPRAYKIYFEGGSVEEVMSYDAEDAALSGLVQWTAAGNRGLHAPEIVKIEAHLNPNTAAEALQDIFGKLHAAAKDSSRKFTSKKE